MSEAFVWRFLDGAGEEAGTSEGFDSRQEAEAWLSGAFEDLLDSGVEEVELVDGATDSGLYRMSLLES